MKRVGLIALALPVALAGLAAQGFEMGKMWTFEHPPERYFSTTYGFTADSAWFTRARLAALRLPGCSASFVSPHGLVVTNHCTSNESRLRVATRLTVAESDPMRHRR